MLVTTDAFLLIIQELKWT